jgi:glycosyltransferase involved in cell wall biosynthesis
MGSMSNPILTVVLPAHQEESTIQLALARLIECLDSKEITFQARVIVDGPGDRTAEFASQINDDRISVQQQDRNYGKGHAIRTGLKSCHTEFVGYIDSDLDLHPEGLVDALKALQNSKDCVAGAVGSKMHKESQVAYPTSRKILSGLYKRIVRVFFSLDITDTQTGLKVFRRAAVDEVLPLLFSDGFEFDLELLSRLSQKGYTFVETPIHLDFDFKSTVNARTGAKTLIDTLRLAVLLRRSH